MPKAENSTLSGSITVTLSEQSLLLLERIAEGGIYGKNRAEVAARFVDKALEGFVDFPRFRLPLRKQDKRSPAGSDKGHAENVVVTTSRQSKRKR
jgi:hypothetical protein